MKHHVASARPYSAGEEEGTYVATANRLSVTSQDNFNENKRPLLLLDFDDVLNIPLRNPLKPTSDYKWRRKSGWDFDAWSSLSYLNIDDNEKYVITTNTEMIEALKSLEDEGLCEIVWLTTWTQHPGVPKVLIDHEDIAKAHINGMPEATGVQKRYDFLTRLVGREWRAAGGIGPRTPKHFSSTLTQDWWKWDAVQALRRRKYDVVFADDMFAMIPQLRKEEERSDTGLKLIRVKSSQGLTYSDYEDIREWLTLKTQASDQTVPPQTS